MKKLSLEVNDLGVNKHAKLEAMLVEITTKLLSRVDARATSVAKTPKKMALRV